MKIALAMAPWSPEDVFTGDFASDVGGAWHPLGILSIGAYLEREGHTVRIYDGAFITREQMVRNITNFNPDVLGVYSNAFSLERVGLLAEALKDSLPDIKVVIGGPITVGYEENILSLHPEIDFIVVGEGEETISELCKAIKNGGGYSNIRGLIWRENGEIVKNPRRTPIKNLDDLPFPARHLINLRKYKPPLGTYKRLPAVYLFTSRGCNGLCIFCWQMSGMGVMRFRSAESVLAEIDQIHNDFPYIREIRFFDDNFSYDIERAHKICEGLIRRNYDLSFYASARVDNITPGLLKMMKRARFWGVLFGLESMVQKNLNALNKEVTVEQNRNAVLWAKEAGLETVTPVIFGIPGETFEEGLKTIEEVCKLPTDTVNFHALTPFPGTDLYRNIDKYGELATEDLNEYTFEGIAFTPYTMTREQIMELRRTGFREFYGRPGYLIKRALNIRTKWDIMIGMQGLSGLFKTIFKPDSFKPPSFEVG
jgi:radical SAM superfamily enzyme YgiQ (UPF0313 family)